MAVGSEKKDCGGDICPMGVVSRQSEGEGPREEVIRICQEIA
jgi:hypothetical protein